MAQYHVTLSLTPYDRGILREVLTEALADSENPEGKASVQKMLLSVDSAPATEVTEPCIGAVMNDGTVFAGSLNGKPIYAAPADAPLTHTFNQAQEYVATLDAHGDQDWRVPTKDELNVMFQNRAAIGGFYVIGSGPAAWYWSSTEDGIDAWVQRFSDGHQGWDFKNAFSSLRCVRG